MHSHAFGDKLFQETSREWLRERISKENLEEFFNRLDSSDVNSIDGIRLSFKRASTETPGLRSLLSLKSPLATTNISNISDYPSPMSGRYNRRVRQKIASNAIFSKSNIEFFYYYIAIKWSCWITSSRALASRDRA
jgi:hypothetical protein